jgi:hypothetical protein
MAGVGYDELQRKQQQLIRKMVDASVFVAHADAQPIGALTDPADKRLRQLPAGYDDAGWLSDDGAQFSRDVKTSDVTSWGSVEPTRTDITADTTTLAIACQETKRTTIGLYTGADLRGVKPDPVTGEVSIEKPARPGFLYFRVLALGVDLTEAGELYVARFLPNARVTDYDDQNFQSSDDEPLTFPVTFTGFIDSKLGYSERWLFGGPGWAALLEQMGFDPLAPPPPPPKATAAAAAPMEVVATPVVTPANRRKTRTPTPRKDAA